MVLLAVVATFVERHTASMAGAIAPQRTLLNRNHSCHFRVLIQMPLIFRHEVSPFRTSLPPFLAWLQPTPSRNRRLVLLMKVICFLLITRLSPESDLADPDSVT